MGRIENEKIILVMTGLGMVFEHQTIFLFSFLKSVYMHEQNKSIQLIIIVFLQLNAGVTTQLLLSLFRMKGVVHFGIAGNANTKLQIGDVTIPRYWDHTGLWNWQV